MQNNYFAEQITFPALNVKKNSQRKQGNKSFPVLL